MEFDHPIAIKVMRLAKPSFFQPIPDIGEAVDGFVGVFDHSSYIHRPKNLTSMHKYSYSGLCLFPQAAGDIYLGQTFKFCVCVSAKDKNMIRPEQKQSEFVENLRVKIEMQSPSKNNVLIYDSSTSGDTNTKLIIGSVFNIPTLQYEIRDLKHHTLMCSVDYTYHGITKTLKKLFKLNSLSPFDVKTTFLETNAHDYILVAQIKNTTSSALFPYKINLSGCGELYNVEELSQAPEDYTNDALLPLDCNVLEANEWRKYIFKVSIKSEISSSRLAEEFRKGIVVAPKLNLFWKTSFGDNGRLQTVPLNRTLTSDKPVLIRVRQCPGLVARFQRFSITLDILNLVDMLDLRIRLQPATKNDSHILWSGLSDQHLGSLSSTNTKTVKLHAVAISTGKLSLPTLDIIDLLTNKTYSFSQVATIFVEQEGGKGVKTQSAGVKDAGYIPPLPWDNN